MFDKYITSTIVFGTWTVLAILAIREYIRVLKTPGISLFMLPDEIKRLTDETTIQAIKRWNRKIRTFFLIWVITCLLSLLLSSLFS